jgi:hypothetical protein
MEMRDRYDEALGLWDAGVELARRVGDGPWETNLLAGSLESLKMLGQWDDGLARAREIRSRTPGSDEGIPFEVIMEAQIVVERGETEAARDVLTRLSQFGHSEEVQARAFYEGQLATVRRGEGDYGGALKSARQAIDAHAQLGWTHSVVKHTFVEAAQAAIALGDQDTLADLLRTVDGIPAGELMPYMEAQRARLGAAILGPSWEQRLKQAAGMFRELGAPFWLAVTLLEHAEHLARAGRTEELAPLLDEARTIFERLGARPWVERLERVAPRPAETLRPAPIA